MNVIRAVVSRDAQLLGSAVVLNVALRRSVGERSVVDYLQLQAWGAAGKFAGSLPPGTVVEATVRVSQRLVDGKSYVDLVAERVVPLAGDFEVERDAKGAFILVGGVNDFRIEGNLVRDAEQFSSSGVRGTVAVDERFRNAAGERMEHTSFIDWSGWDGVGAGVVRGARVILRGAMVTRGFESKANGKAEFVFRTELVAAELLVCAVGAGSAAGESAVKPPVKVAAKPAGGKAGLPLRFDGRASDPNSPPWDEPAEVTPVAANPVAVRGSSVLQSPDLPF